MFSQLLLLVLLDSVLAKSLSSNGNEHLGVGRYVEITVQTH